jgi:hypothetical protein
MLLHQVALQRCGDDYWGAAWAIHQKVYPWGPTVDDQKGAKMSLRSFVARSESRGSTSIIDITSGFEPRPHYRALCPRSYEVSLWPHTVFMHVANLPTRGALKQASMTNAIETSSAPQASALTDNDLQRRRWLAQRNSRLQRFQLRDAFPPSPPTFCLSPFLPPDHCCCPFTPILTLSFPAAIFCSTDATV